MHLLRATVNQQRNTKSSSRLRSSLKQKIIKDFVPFENERDKIGRLIKPTCPQQTLHPSIKSSKMSFQRQSAVLEQKIDKYFKQNNLSNSYETNKNKRIKKTIIDVITTGLSINQKKNKSFQKSNTKNIKDIQEINTKFCLTADSSKYKRFSLDNKRVSRMQRVQSSSNNRKHFDYTPLQKFNSTQLSLPKQTIPRPPSSNLQPNYKQYPQLQRFVQMQSLQMKTLDDFEQNHVKFLAKMKESKQLAFQLRYNIQHIDYI